MPIDFSPQRWDCVKQTYEAWWEGTLGRPLVSIMVNNRDPGRPEPRAALLSQATCEDLSVPAADVIDRIDYELSGLTFLGDSFPYFNLDCYGPGVAAAFCGAKLDNSSGRVWFSVDQAVPIDELHFEYDGNNVWLNRVKDICREAMKRWQGQVLIGMADLGGMLDILSTFRTTENLLMDLYDSPEEVERLVWELYGLWHRFYDEINEVLQPVNPGYSDWSGIYSAKPCYILQSDFCYMIGPEMFERFVKPELAASCKRLPRAFYHLDGVGQLPHLDSLLAIRELDGVQWVPGDGKPGQIHWMDVYRKIVAAGKRTQIWDGFACLDEVIAQTGSPGSIHMKAGTAPAARKAEIRGQLRKYGIG